MIRCIIVLATQRAPTQLVLIRASVWTGLWAADIIASVNYDLYHQRINSNYTCMYLHFIEGSFFNDFYNSHCLFLLLIVLMRS